MQVNQRREFHDRKGQSSSYICSSWIFLFLPVVPVCATAQQWVYGSGRRELVNITCDVEALPLPHTFAWSLNTSSTDLLDVPRSRIVNKELSSVLAYSPHSPLDYGSLLCWAENSVGRQREPCVFQVTWLHVYCFGLLLF